MATPQINIDFNTARTMYAQTDMVGASLTKLLRERVHRHLMAGTPPTSEEMQEMVLHESVLTILANIHNTMREKFGINMDLKDSLEVCNHGKTAAERILDEINNDI